MLDLAAPGLFILPEFREMKLSPADKRPSIRFRIPTANEAVDYSTSASDFRASREIDEGELYKMTYHHDFPNWAAAKIIPFVQSVEGINNAGSPMNWSAMNESERVDLLLRLGSTPQGRLFALVKLTSEIFVGLSAAEKKTFEDMSPPDLDPQTSDANAPHAAEILMTE